MGDFGAIVRVLGCVVWDQGHYVPMRDTVAAQLVGRQRAVSNVPCLDQKKSVLSNRFSKSPIEPLEMDLGTVRTKSGQMVCKRSPDPLRPVKSLTPVREKRFAARGDSSQ